jgi:hypothetical protein
MGCSTLASICSGKPIPIYTLPHILDIVLPVFLGTWSNSFTKFKTWEDSEPSPEEPTRLRRLTLRDLPQNWLIIARVRE